MTRGIRLNNPGLMRKSGDTFVGEAPSNDEEFKAFATMEWGIRCLAKTLLTYHRRHKLETVRGIISRWAPPFENDTEAYVDDVCQMMEVRPTQKLDLEDQATLINLCRGIIKHENGFKNRLTREHWIDEPTMLKGIQLALVGKK